MSEAALRVAVVGACPYFAPQGSQVYLRECAHAVAVAGAEVYLVVYGYGQETGTDRFAIHRSANPLRARTTAAGPHWGKPILDWCLLRTLRGVVRQRPIDVLDAHNYEGLLIALASGFRPVVYHPHNAMSDELPHYMRWKKTASQIGSMLDRSLPRRADAIIAPHIRLRNYLISARCEPDRVHVVAPPMRSEARTPQPQPTESPAIVYTGNLDVYQNLALLERVAELVRERRPGARLIVASAARAELSWAECVQTPDLNALQRVLAEDVIVVCPRTSWSGYPIKLLNAMAAGVPIVCCASAAHALVHGETGLIVADDDATAMSDAVVGLYNDWAMRRRLGNAARAAFERNHDPTFIGESMLEIYRSVLRGA